MREEGNGGEGGGGEEVEIVPLFGLEAALRKPVANTPCAATMRSGDATRTEEAGIQASIEEINHFIVSEERGERDSSINGARSTSPMSYSIYRFSVEETRREGDSLALHLSPQLRYLVHSRH